MHEYLAKEELTNAQFDESYHYDVYQRAIERETELHAKLYDPSNKDIDICALCKHYILRN